MSRKTFFLISIVLAALFGSVIGILRGEITATDQRITIIEKQLSDCPMNITGEPDDAPIYGGKP